MAQPESDASILEGCRNGDPDAQRHVFEQHKDGVFSIALNFLEGDHAAAEKGGASHPDLAPQLELDITEIEALVRFINGSSTIDETGQQ